MEWFVALVVIGVVVVAFWHARSTACPNCQRLYVFNFTGRQRARPGPARELELFCENCGYCEWRDELEAGRPRPRMDR